MRSVRVGMPGNTSLELTIPQLQLLPTLSLLLGIPIPFGSIGSVSPDLWALGIPSTQTAQEQLPHLRCVVHLLLSESKSYVLPESGEQRGPTSEQSSPLPWVVHRDALAKNAWQVHRYLLEYNGGRGGGGRFNDARLSECFQLHTLSGQLHNRSLEDAGQEILGIHHTSTRMAVCSMPLVAVTFEPPNERHPPPCCLAQA